jgi:hypothetical protein
VGEKVSLADFLGHDDIDIALAVAQVDNGLESL